MLVAKNIRGDRLQGVDVELWPGEVLGLAGVEGNGQRDFIRGLAGLTAVSGEITVKGAAVATSNPVAAQKGGIIFLPGDRHAEGLLLSLSVRENMTLLVLDTLTRFGTGLARARACGGGLVWLFACDKGAVARDDHLEFVWRQPAEGPVCSVDGRQSGRIPGG